MLRSFNLIRRHQFKSQWSLYLLKSRKRGQISLISSSFPNMNRYKLNLRTKDLPPGSFQEANVEGVYDAKVLVSNLDGKYYAVGARCTHYGAPLVKGILSEKDSTVRCAWHSACFSLKTGDIEDGPALDPLNTYKIDVFGEDIFVHAEPSALVQGSCEPPIKSGKVDESSDPVVIVGAGGAGARVIEIAAQYGCKHPFLLITKDQYLGIDRTKLSKALPIDTEAIQLRSREFLEKRNTKVLEGIEVTSVDTENHKVKTSSGEEIKYSKLVLATGGQPNMLPDDNLKNSTNVFTLRHMEDVWKIKDALAQKEKPRVVIIGSSFIGMELAFALKDQHVTVLSDDELPFAHIFGNEVGKIIEGIHEKSRDTEDGNTGVTLKLTSKFKNAEASWKILEMLSKFFNAGTFGKKVTTVVTEDENRYDADVVIVAVGIKPATGYLPKNLLQKDGSVKVDSHMMVEGVQDVYAMGDIATFPLKFTGNDQRIEHWVVSQNHARAIGRHLAGMNDGLACDQVPVFWSVQGGSIRFVGSRADCTEEFIDKDPKDPSKFIAYYGNKVGYVRAVASLGRDPYAMKMVSLWRENKKVKMEDVRNGTNILNIH